MPVKDIELYIYSKGIMHCSVCVLKEATPRQIAFAVEAEHPAGETLKWQVSKEPTFKGGEPNPSPCDHEPDKRLHYLMEC